MSELKAFSLIELMVTIAIVGILASVAIPSYSSYVIRSNLVDMTDGLAAMSARMEIYFQDNRTYQDVGAFNSPCQNIVAENYSITCAGAPAAYTLTATGNDVIADFTFTLNQTGARQTTAARAGWGAVPAACWHVNQGGSC